MASSPPGRVAVSLAAPPAAFYDGNRLPGPATQLARPGAARAAPAAGPRAGGDAILLGRTGETVNGEVPGQGFRISSVDGITVVTPPPEITLENAEQLRDALAAASAQHATIAVDMTDNEFCDSSGISELVMAFKRARAGGGEVRLVMNKASVRRIFKVTGVDGIFRIFETVPQAAAAAPAASPAGRVPPEFPAG
jgi:anti-sigma B factor antagonist